ncbi:MAG: sigma 54-interacting transcriptional regulator, partial [Candidatus Zixiibacteriota bacterium]
NCAAIPNERVEAELFGHIKGSYTGAIADRPGLIEQAENGTLYLNEIADATPEFQAKLLEVLETRMVRRLGSNSVRKVSFRLIAATNHDLQQRMRDNLFRQDLYHRLNDIPMTLPPLSQRCEDFEPLVRHFLTEAGMAFNGDTPKIDRLATMLASSEWPGNVRQLRASLRTLYLSSHGDVDKMLTGAAELIATSQRDRLLAALEQSEWNRTRAAEMFGVSEGTIRNWIRRYEIAETAGVEA